jgi:hypothetical protein
LCRSAWGLLEIEAALGVLETILAAGGEKDFAAVQEAINMYWAAASFYEDSQASVLSAIANGLASWKRGEGRSLMSIAPPVHVAWAIRKEISYQMANLSQARPLLLREDLEGVSARAALAALLNRGLREKHSREFVRGALTELSERAKACGALAAFWVLLETIAAAGDADDGARIASYRQSWSARLGVSAA